MIDFERERSGNQYIHHQFCEYLSNSVNIHNSYEFVHISDGKYNVKINRVNYELNGGDCLLVLPGQIHSFDTVTAAKEPPFLCIFSPDMVRDFSDIVVNSDLVNPVFRLGDSKLIHDFAQANNQFLQKSFLYQICGLASQAKFVKREYTEDKELIYKIVDYINKKYMEELTLKQMSADLGYNYTYLSAFFNKHFGEGFSSFINEYRVTFAKQLLKDSTLNMSQIAMECGFFTIRNFNRAFLQKEHLPPKEFRELRTR